MRSMTTGRSTKGGATGGSSSDNVKVFCRVRPLSKSEATMATTIGEGCLGFPQKDNTSITCTTRVAAIGNTAVLENVETHCFSFSEVFDPAAAQRGVYDEVALPVVEDVMSGYNGTIFAYGQTGSGKTHTMFGTAPGLEGHTPRRSANSGTPRKLRESGPPLFVSAHTQQPLHDTDEGGGGSSSRWLPPQASDSDGGPTGANPSFSLSATSTPVGTSAGAAEKFQRSNNMVALGKCKRRPRSGLPLTRKGHRDEVCHSATTTPRTICTSGQNTPTPKGERSSVVAASEHTRTPDMSAGIVPRAVDGIFSAIAAADADMEFEVRLFFVEVYMEQVRDLLNPTSGRVLPVREDVRANSFYVEGCEMPYVTSTAEVLHIVKSGVRHRTTRATAMNETSSRSHCILNITVKSLDRRTHEAKVGKLFLVDLAGSEKVSKTKSAGMRLEEAKLINKSLTTLGIVIVSLSEMAQHVPYRDSILTKILKDSLGGNSRTSLIICCSPSPYNLSETLSTLRFGARAKNVQNRAIVNRDYTPDELRSMLDIAKEEIARLNARLHDRHAAAGEASGSRSTHAALTRGDATEAGGGTEESFSQRAHQSLVASKLQSRIGELSDALHTAEETIAALTEQRDSQDAELESYEEETRLWEKEYVEMKREMCGHARLAENYRACVWSQQREIQLLIEQMEGHLDPIRAARAALEGPRAGRQRMMDSNADNRCSTSAVPPPAHAIPPLRISELGLHGGQPTTASQFQGHRHGTYSGGEGSYSSFGQTDQDDVHVASEISGVPAGHVNGGASAPPPPEGHRSYPDDERIAYLEEQVRALTVDIGTLRRNFSATVVELHLAEKKLCIRQDRLSDLSRTLEHEGRANEELRQLRERERVDQWRHLEKAHNDAAYWRRRYDDLRGQLRVAAADGRGLSALRMSASRSQPAQENAGDEWEPTARPSWAAAMNIFRPVRGGRVVECDPNLLGDIREE